MANPPKKEGSDWKWWITTGLVLLGLISGGAWRLESELGRIDKHIAKVETAVRIIGAKQGGDTKTLVDEALAVAKNASDAGRTESARAVLDIANHLLAEQNASREPAPQEFFDNTIQKYRSLRKFPALVDSVWVGVNKLAEYRSSANTVPTGMEVHIGHLGQRGPFRLLQDSYISGPNAIAFGNEKGFVLDGFILENVIFSSTVIIYHGGPVVLQNVRFVNCQFVVRRLPQSELLLEAATKETVNATIG